MAKHSQRAARRGALTLVTIGTLAACTDHTGPGEGPVVVQAIAMEKPLPGAAPVIHYRIENIGSRPVFILACGEHLVAELEQRHSGGAAWGPADAAVRCPANLLYLPMVVGAHGAGEGYVAVPGRGTYRLRVPYRIGHREGHVAAAVSASIEVVAS